MRYLKLTLRLLLPLLVLGAAAWGAWLIYENRPVPVRRKVSQNVLHVEVREAIPTDYRVMIESRGTVQPRIETTIVTEVSGKIFFVSEKFTDGGYFEAGELLLEIDPQNYRIAVEIAKAELERQRYEVLDAQSDYQNSSNQIAVFEAALSQAQTSQQEEQMRSEMAIDEWRKLGTVETPSALVERRFQVEQSRLRVLIARAQLEEKKISQTLIEPRIKATQAQVQAAEARLQRAQLDLERTRIYMPYTGRILKHRCNIGQFVQAGNALAEIYAVDYAEVRLPLSDRQLAHLDLPLHFQDRPEEERAALPVVVEGAFGGRTYTWEGQIIRTEGTIDTKTRQWFAVARIPNPYTSSGDRPPLKMGMFVSARIYGRLLQQVFVLPRALLRNNERVAVVVADTVAMRTVELAWSDSKEIVLKAGIEAGDLICVSPLPSTAEALKVAVKKVAQELADAAAEQEHRGAPQP